MSDVDDRSGGRRKGLFRRNREAEFTTPAPWAADEWDEPLDPADTVGETETAPAAHSSSPRRRTSADMFAQRERGWTDAWGDDAWDDEWRDPAFRRPSIPAAAAPQPAEVDAWLDDDADSWSDVTRETTLRWGGKAPADAPKAVQAVQATLAAEEPVAASTATARPLPPSTIVPQPQVAAQVAAQAPATSVSDDPVERALATVEHQSIDLTDRVRPSTEHLAHVAPATTPQLSVEDADGDLPSFEAIEPPVVDETPRPRFRRTRTVRRDDPVPVDPATELMSTPVSETPEESVDPWDDATGPLSVHSGPITSEADADEPELVGAAARRIGRREAAFSDRATWIGSMVAGLAALRLLFSVSSGMRAADPVGESFGLFTRIGRGMADLGVTQGALLVLAVVLISLPSLLETKASQRFDSRIAGGLGLCLGAAVVGVLGALLAWSAQRHIAGLENTGGGATSMRLLGEFIATAGLCLVAFAGALRAVRSFHD